MAVTVQQTTTSSPTGQPNTSGTQDSRQGTGSSGCGSSMSLDTNPSSFRANPTPTDHLVLPDDHELIELPWRPWNPLDQIVSMMIQMLQIIQMIFQPWNWFGDNSLPSMDSNTTPASGQNNQSPTQGTNQTQSSGSPQNGGEITAGSNTTSASCATMDPSNPNHPPQQEADVAGNSMWRQRNPLQEIMGQVISMMIQMLQVIQMMFQPWNWFGGPGPINPNISGQNPNQGNGQNGINPNP